MIKINLIDKNSLPKTLDYAFINSPFGNSMLVFKEKQLFYFYFCQNECLQILAQLKQKHQKIIFKENNNEGKEIVDSFFNLELKNDYSLVLCGTPFQLQVWETLLTIPYGKTITYSELAKLSGYPKAIRAVASAVARNPLAYLIPCHRIIPKHGKNIGNYRWGKEIKEKIIQWETINA